jgi:acylpyruvate hydrolase
MVHTEERIGAVLGNVVIDLNSAYASYLEKKGETNPGKLADAYIPSNMIQFLSNGEKGFRAAEEAIEYYKGEPGSQGVYGEKTGLSLEDVRLMPPIPKPGKLYCVAVNYYDHATESIQDLGKRSAEIQRLKELSLDEPVVFQKPPGLIVGPRSSIIKPMVSEKLDYECELAVVIGKEGKYIKQQDAYEHIAGYTILIDVSFRDQGFPSDVDFRMFRTNVNWTKGKGMDNAAPTGPWIVTKDEIPDPHNPPMKIITRVNEKVRQNGDLSNMIIKIPRLVEYLSNGTTLKPGDIIATGTVAGVARSWPDGFLKVGDTVECEIPRIGSLKLNVIKDPSTKNRD